MSAWLEARKQAASRRRRVLYNNDGDDVCYALEPTPEAFLAVRSEGIQGTHIDTYVYSSMCNFNSCVHDSRVAEIITTKDPFGLPRNQTQALIDRGHDSLSLIIGFCRRHDLEVFWSYRLNDVHDNWSPEMLTHLKRNRPDLTLWQEGDYGRPGDGLVEPSMYFTAMDYGQEEVRQIVFDTTRDVCERYDVDGVELDFMRNPMYFRPNMEGRPVEASHTEMMTGLMQRIRDMVDEVGQKRGRPILLSVRVPNNLQSCGYLGLEVERWMRDRMVDFVIPSSEFDPFTGDIREMTELAHSYGMPAYACLSGSVHEEGWPAATLNALAGGADGVATFNDFAPRNPAWSLIGDPARMVQVDRAYEVDVLDLARVRMHEHVMVRQGRLPMTMTSGALTEVTLPVGEGVASRSADTNLTLSVVLDHCAYGDQVELFMNGSPLTHRCDEVTDGMAPLAVGTARFLAEVDHRDMREGPNRVGVRVTPIESRAACITIQQIKLFVRMKN